MRYVILHTPRVGSNVLCDMLVQTKRAGMTQLNDAGFFIGLGETLPAIYKEGAVERYFRKHKTNNDVEGCKLGWDYIEHLNQHLGFGRVDTILDTFDKAILLTRKDKIAQAVSRLVAKETGQWTSIDPSNNKTPEYSARRISYFIAQAKGHEEALIAYCLEVGLPLRTYVYEDHMYNWNQLVQEISLYLDLDVPIGFRSEPTLSQQLADNKAYMIKRYKDERGKR